MLTTRMSDQSPASPHAEKAEKVQEGSPVASESPQPAMDNATEQQEEEPAQQEEDNLQQTPQSHKEESNDTAAPPLPDEIPPPLPDEAPPGQAEDDGWEPVWEPTSQAYYFYNRITGLSQWDNPRVPTSVAPGTAPGTQKIEQPPRKKSPVLGGYNPAIHGDYDPTAAYAQQYEEQEEDTTAAIDPAAAYTAAGSFNRFTGRWQADSINPENHNDANKSSRQMNAYFDVDAAANAHDGRSLRAERSAKRLSKKELKQFKDKRREKKEEKRRAWLRD